MEQFNAMQQETLLVELTQGWETANQLRSLQIPDDVNSEALIEKILSTYDRALAMLTGSWRAIKEEDLIPNPPETDTGGMLSSLFKQPHSPIASSPLSEISNGVPKDEKCHKSVSKKRKISGKWNQEIQVCTVRQDGVSLDDGYSWRKYGQKDILGANHPRNYYRCTHRNSRGCLATKQVQRKDEDPSTLDIIYKGKHTCVVQTANPTSILTFSEPEKPSKSRKTGQVQVAPPQQTLQDLAQGLRVDTDHHSIDKKKKRTNDGEEEDEIFTSFSFPLELMDGCSPTTPATSDSYYFSPSPTCDFINSKYDLTNLINTPTSVLLNSPFEDLDHFLVDDQADCDPNFLLDHLEYFA